ncbi:MAG: MFS transporter [Chloroflexi bacterium]|nr:MFS transporter [Chloroflexota bacterium]MDA1145416.1 MFS transporter [Chloroflexota bacterium]
MPDPPRGRVFYGWYIVAGCNAIALVTWGVAIFINGIFIAYFVDERGWSRASLSVGHTLFQITAGLVGILVGRTVDRRGPRSVFLVGGTVVAIGIASLGFATTVWHTYVAFTILGAGFACLHTVTLGKTIARWFVRSRTRAMTIATFGASIGGMILAPINANVLGTWGAPTAGLLLAVFAIAVVWPVATFVIRNDPAALGLRPDGANGAATEASTDRDEDAAAPERAWTLAEATHQRAFWALALTLPLGMFAQGSFLIHQVSYLTSGSFTLVQAAAVVTAVTVASTVGRALFVFVGDLLSPPLTNGIVFLIQAVAFAVLAVAPTPAMQVAGSILFGFTMGVLVILQPLSVAAAFGERTFGAIYGQIYLAIRIGAAAGPLAVGVGTVAFGYPVVWGALSCGLVVAAIAVVTTVPRSPSVHAQAPADAAEVTPQLARTHP